MSHIYLIVSDNDIQGITKERFLKFHNIDNCQSDRCGYYRYDEGLCQATSNDQYCIYNQLVELLKNYTKQSKNLFFARFLLPDKSNEIDAFNHSLKAIDEQDYLQANIMDSQVCLRLNTVYQIS